MRHSRWCYLGKPLLALAAIAVLAAVVMWLWNAAVPAAVSGANPIDYPHALGLLLLSRILFGGFRGHGGWHGHRRWQRWPAMTPEEREQFAHAMHRRRHRGERQ